MTSRVGFDFINKALFLLELPLHLFFPPLGNQSFNPQFIEAALSPRREHTSF